MAETPTPGQAFYVAYMAAHSYGDFSEWGELTSENQRAMEAGARAVMALARDDARQQGLTVAFRFADIDIRATCECDWTATGDSAQDAFSAWWKHRHAKHPDAP